MGSNIATSVFWAASTTSLQSRGGGQTIQIYSAQTRHFYVVSTIRTPMFGSSSFRRRGS